MSANFCAKYEKRRTPEYHVFYPWSKMIMEIRLGKLRSEEHVARMHIFINVFTFPVKEPKMRHKLEACSSYITLKLSSNIGENVKILSWLMIVLNVQLYTGFLKTSLCTEGRKCDWHLRKWAYAVGQLIEALRYKAEGREFDSRRCHWHNPSWGRLSLEKKWVKKKGNAVPFQAWAGPEVSRRLRLPNFKTIGTWRW
jgi:hypothetical protein